MKKLLGRFMLLSLFSMMSPLSAACLGTESVDSSASISAVLLLPLNSEEHPMGDAFHSGFVEGDIETIEERCEVILTTVNTLEEGGDFIDQWNRALEMKPDLLIGPLLQQHQQQLAELELLALPETMYWLYPGELEKLSLPASPQRLSFSAATGSQLRTLLEFGWDQGQYDLLLLLPDSAYGRSVAEEARRQWEEKGGAIPAQVHYGKRYSDLNAALRKAIVASGGEFDVLLLVADDQRLRMIRPLMNYHDREEPVYTLTTPVGVVKGDKDVDGLFYPMQPALLEREESGFDVDDLLRQIENVGFDLMMVLRQGGWGELQQKGSYFGRAGRYSVERNHLFRQQCVATLRAGEQQPLYCPEPIETTDGEQIDSLLEMEKRF